MMKRRIVLLVLAAVLMLNAGATAAPALTDGSVTAWITSDNMLRLQNANGVIYTLNTPVKDLLSIDSDTLYLLDKNGQLVSVRKDGSMGNVLKSMPTADDIEVRKETRFHMTGSILTAGGAVISQAARNAACDGTYLYWTEQTEGVWVLRQAPLQGKEGSAAPLDNVKIAEPLYMTVTPEGLTIVAADHSVTSYNLVSGNATAYPAAGNQTAAAAVAGGELIRYAAAGDNAWTAETDSNRVIPIVTPETTAAPVPTATRQPTATPAPTATVRPTPTVTPDDRIHKGDRGTAVRRIQNRLDELGYPVGKIDGIYGQDTQTAISLFMNAIHVAEHNYITPYVRRKLFDKNAPEYDPYLPLKKGDSGLSVRYMQERLRDLGYEPEKVDGKYGDLTVKAVERFQEAAGLKVDGTKASAKMLKKLYSKDAPTLLVTVSGGVYKLGETTATLIRPSSRSVKTITILSTVEANGRSYSVTSIGKGACKGLTSLKKVTIGANVKKIGAEAFSGCTKLEKISVKTTHLTDAKMGANVFTGVPKDAVVTCPAELVKTYKKLFRAHGLSKKVEFNP